MTHPTKQIEPVPPRSARAAVLVAGCSGVLALFSTALVNTPHVAVFALTCCVVFAQAAWAPVLWPTAGGLLVRRGLSSTLLAATLILCFAKFVRLDPNDIAGITATFGGFLGRLLISVLLAQLFVTDRMRDLRVALLLAGAMFVLAVATDAGWVVVAALVVGWPAGVAALAIDHSVGERSKADAVARPTRTSPGTGWARIGWFAAVSAVVAVLLVLLVPHPDGVRPRQGGAVARGGAGQTPTSGAAPRTSTGYTSGSMDMRSRGALPATPVADVPVDSPTLWRGTTLDYYDGTTWSASDRNRASLLPEGPHVDLSVDATTFGTGVERTDAVRRRPGFYGVVIAPGQPTAIDVAGRVLRVPGGFSVGPGAGGYPMTYTVTSTSTDLPAAQLSHTPVVTADVDAPGNALQLPTSLPERVRALGRRLTATAPNRLAATRAVETYLGAHATYRLDSPVPPPGADAVDHFLFEAHTGFCEQFAAAEVVLLRASGVPARLATGFAGGTAAGDHRTLLGSDAHAWVEVWYPGIGWSSSDPTAGARLADQTLLDRASALLRGHWGRVLMAAGLLLTAALVAVLVWWLRRRLRRAVGPDDQGAVAAPLPPVLAAFARVQRALDEAGTPRSPAESVSELAKRPALRGAAGALAVVERTAYAAQAPVGAEATDAERILDALARRLSEQASETAGTKR
jgi:hypothetical protein